jgi:hypothetical protein
VTPSDIYLSYLSAFANTDRPTSNPLANVFPQYADAFSAYSSNTYYGINSSGTLNLSFSSAESLGSSLTQTNFYPATIPLLAPNATVEVSTQDFSLFPLIEVPSRILATASTAILSSDAQFRPVKLNVRGSKERRRARAENSPQLIAEWEGYVTNIESQTFQARLRGISGRGVEGEIEDAVIPIREVGSRDNPQFAVGALFRLCVSEVTFGDEVQRATKLVFRRLPAYRREDLEAARTRALARAHAIRLDDRRTASGSE